MAGRLRSGRRRWSEPRHCDRRGEAGVHDPGQSRAFTALRLIDLVTAVHSHMNELATLEFGLQQLARLEDELQPDGALPGPLCWRSPPARALAPSSVRMPSPRQRCRPRRSGGSLSCRSRSRPAIAGLTVNGRRAARSPGWCTSSTPGSLLMSRHRIRMIGASGPTSSWSRCATTGRPRASCRASA